MHLICFSQYIYYFLIIFTENQLYCFSKNNPEQSWRYSESSSTTNDCRGQQHRSHYQPVPYNEYHQYHNDITAQINSYFNLYEGGK